MTSPSAPPPDPIRLAKRELRARCRRLRDELGEAGRAEASRTIGECILAWSVFRSAGLALAFLPMSGEIDLQPLMARASGVRWAIPRAVGPPAPHLVFHELDPRRLIRHRYGMLEPDPALPEVAPQAADLIIVPGLAFTRAGYRLGYGGGFYDRLLAAVHHVPTLGVCFEALVLEDMPRTAHDLPVDYLVTEGTGIRACRSAV